MPDVEIVVKDKDGQVTNIANDLEAATEEATQVMEAVQ